MNILMLSQYFYPEVGATQTRVHKFAKYLAQKGHKVTVIAEFPNHPTGIIPEDYKGKLFEREYLDGFEVLRVWVLTSPEKGTLLRIGFYTTYMLMAIIAGFFLRKKYDVVFATSPPLFVGVSGYVLSRLKGASFLFDVRDLWPAVAVALGELSNEKIIKIAEKVELFLYEKAKAIAAVTGGFIKYIVDLGIKSSKLYHIPNGTIPEIFDPADTDLNLKEKLGLKEKFIVSFAGNHGLAQGLETLIESAKQLKKQKDIVFFFIGEGPVKQNLIDLKEKYHLKNVVFHHKVPLNEVAKYINMSDILLVPLKKDEIFRVFVPSKMFDFMCCGKPIILSVPGEARQIMHKAKAGKFIPPEDATALSEMILFLKDNPKLAEEYGKNGREFVLKNCLRKQQAKKLEPVMLSLNRKR